MPPNPPKPFRVEVQPDPQARRVFVVPQGETAAVVYLYKPLYGLAIVAVGVLAGFLIARSNAPKA